MDKKQAMELKRNGFSYKEIGKLYGVSGQAVQQALSPPAAIKQAVIRRAKHRCQGCGSRLNGHGLIHHVGGEDYDYNDLNNLQYLCFTCHALRHAGIYAHPLPPTENDKPLIPTCPECTSTDVRKCGTRQRNHQTIQKYICKSCYRIFAEKGEGK